MSLESRYARSTISTVANNINVIRDCNQIQVDLRANREKFEMELRKEKELFFTLCKSSEDYSEGMLEEIAIVWQNYE